MSDTNKLDDRLILKIATGDRAAFEQLYTDTKTAVYGYLLSLLKNTHDAEDLMHDTYVCIYNSAKSYKPMGKPMAWIFTIARNLALMKLRSSQKTDLSLEESRVLEEDNAPEYISDKLLLNAALRILPEIERQIVILHSVGGFKHREIAEFLTLPLSTVLSKYHRSLAKLKKEIKEYYHE